MTCTISHRRSPWRCWKWSGALAAVVGCCFTALPCAAHQKWLWPNFFAAEKAPVWLSIDVTWSDTPFTAEAGVGERPIWVVDPSGQRRTPAKLFVGQTKSVAEAELKAPGTYRLESIDPPTYWTRVEENGKQQWLEKPKTEVTSANIIRADLYWSKAAAYVTLGEPSDVPPPDDMEPLDIRLGTHPNRIKMGEPVELRLLSYGKPLGQTKVNIFAPESTGHDPTQVIECDKDGVARIQLDAPGRYLLSCELEQQVKDDPKADVHSFNFYLTLLVQPQSK